MFIDQTYLGYMCLQLLGYYIFLWSKTPKDCFKCFSKATNIKYSIFQYVRYIYTEQMEKVRKNHDLIEKIKAQDKTGAQVIELEFDDYLNAEETLEAYKCGIDMQYMVEHLGGSLIEDT